MIQVCSQCGTRWNVRDRQRAWCPRCNGALLLPSGAVPGSEWSARPSASPLQPSGQRTPPRLPAGYRWIAVRPGAAPPARRGRRPLGPTPRYSMVPRWGLVEHFGAVDEQQQQAAPRSGPSAAMVRNTLFVAMVALAFAALVHMVRYALLLINRTVLLNPLVAGAATWLGVLASVVALFMVVASVVVLTNWLISRRAAAYAHHGRTDPRSVWELRLGCLVPSVNGLLAPFYVIELATLEDKYTVLRRPIVVWWVVWLVSYCVSAYSIWTSFATDPQGIADNTVTTTVAYLTALAALLLARQVFMGFERIPVERPARRWVMVPDDAVPSEPEGPADPEREAVEAEPERKSPVPVESEGQNPAA